MKILLTTTATIVAALTIAVPAAAQRVPAASVAVVDLGRVSSQCNACRPAATALQGQVTALRARQQQLQTTLQAEGTGIQTAVNALAGKAPDAALTARIRALQTKQDAANAELQRGQTQIQRNQQYIQQQIDSKLGPVIDGVMQRRGANLVVEAGSTLKVGAGLDVTADVLTALNAALPSLVTTAPAAPATTPPSR